MHQANHIRVHVVFGTKERARWIAPAVQSPLWRYLRGIGRNLGIEIDAVGGTEDHVHLLFLLPPAMAVATAVQKIKANSSRWMKQHVPRFAWQDGYGAFSVSASHVAATVKYIENQPDHHQRVNFAQEWAAFLKKHGVEVPSLRDSED